MSSKAANAVMRSAAWRISLWASLAFAIGTVFVFAMLHGFVANDIQRRSDAWLSGEVKVLGDVAERTPKDRLYHRVVGEVAELASREVPNRQQSSGNENDSVFFLQADESGPAQTLGWLRSWDGNSSRHPLHSRAAGRARGCASSGLSYTVSSCLCSGWRWQQHLSRIIGT